jgi:hypothetical protein
VAASRANKDDPTKPFEQLSVAGWMGALFWLIVSAVTITAALP